MTAQDRAAALMNDLKRLGLRLALDEGEMQPVLDAIAAAIEAAVAEARTASAKDALRSVAPNERLSVMSEYCYYCGGPAKPNGKYCECWNDE